MIVVFTPSSFFCQVVTRIIKKIRSSWKTAPMFTSLAMLQPLSQNFWKVSVWCVHIKDHKCTKCYFISEHYFCLNCTDSQWILVLFFFCQALMVRKSFWLLFQSSAAPKWHAWWTYALFSVSLSASQPFVLTKKRKVRWTSATECWLLLTCRHFWHTIQTYFFLVITVLTTLILFDRLYNFASVMRANDNK